MHILLVKLPCVNTLFLTFLNFSSISQKNNLQFCSTASNVKGKLEETPTRHCAEQAPQAPGFSLPWREGVRGRGKFTLTLFLSHQERGDFTCHCNEQPIQSKFLAYNNQPPPGGRGLATSI